MRQVSLDSCGKLNHEHEGEREREGSLLFCSGCLFHTAAAVRGVRVVRSTSTGLVALSGQRPATEHRPTGGSAKIGVLWSIDLEVLQYSSSVHFINSFRIIESRHPIPAVAVRVARGGKCWCAEALVAPLPPEQKCGFSKCGNFARGSAARGESVPSSVRPWTAPASAAPVCRRAGSRLSIFSDALLLRRRLLLPCY